MSETREDIDTRVKMGVTLAPSLNIGWDLCRVVSIFINKSGENELQLMLRIDKGLPRMVRYSYRLLIMMI